MKNKTIILGLVFPVVLVLDILTKRWAMAALRETPMELLGGLIPLNLAFNRGAAFGLTVGHDPRWFFVPVTILALLLLGYLLLNTSDHDRFRLWALSLVFTGALGNLIDRVRWNRGVVDFIGPIDLGFMDWPIFNVADMAISCGAVALAISFWSEDRVNSRRGAELAREGGAEGAG